MGGMGTTVFVDESKRGRYTLVGAAVPDADLGAVRRELRSLIPKGQRRIHFKSDSMATRRRVLHAMVGLPVAAAVIQAPAGAREPAARRGTLAVLVNWMPAGSALRLEIHAGLVNTDRECLQALSRTADFAYEHLPPASDPGLWLPDAIGWCWTRGGSWREAVAPLVRHVVDQE